MQGTSHILAHLFSITDMSKTYEMYLDKARTLVNGLRKNLDVVKGYGIQEADLDKLEAAVREGEQYNETVDRKRAELNAIVPEANQKLAEIKGMTYDYKRIVKVKVNQVYWENFGITDKR